MFVKKSDEGYIDALEGIKRKTLIWGKKTLLTEFRLKKGAVLPQHSHPYEQTGYLLSGKMKFASDDGSFIAEPGDSWCFKGDVKHGAEILEDAVAIEVFAPVREDYIPE